MKTLLKKLFNRFRKQPETAKEMIIPPANIFNHLVPARHVDGFEFLVPHGDFSAISLLGIGDWERYVLSPMLHDARTVENAIDVGANVGLISIPLAKNISGTVYSFELSPRNAQILAYNTQRNDIGNIQIFPIAVGNSMESRIIQLNDFTTLNLLTQTSDASRIFEESVHIVPTVRLDDLFCGRIPVDLIKVDVDGWDYLALSGSAKLIEQDQPIIYTEYCPEAMQNAN